MAPIDSKFSLPPSQMTSYLRPGLIHFMAYPAVALGEGPILESLREVLVDPFYHAVCITHIVDRAKRRAAHALLRQSGMEVTYGAHPAILARAANLNDLDESRRRAAVDLVRRALDEASEVGATMCGFLSGRWEATTQEEALKRLADSIVEIGTYADSLGPIRPVLEIFDHRTDKCALIGPASMARRLADLVRLAVPNFGFSVDLSHTPLIGETPEQAIIPIADCLATADVGNCVLDPKDPLYGDKHPYFGYPAGVNGRPQLVEFLSVLLRVGFLRTDAPPVVSFEIKPQPGEDIDVILTGAKRLLTTAFGEALAAHKGAGP